MSTYAEWAEQNKSDVHGNGWGSDHLWHSEGTPTRTSYYKCARCFWNFGHAYNHEPSIFKAMHDAGVPEKCARQQLWPIRLEYASAEEADRFAKIRSELSKTTEAAVTTPRARAGRPYEHQPMDCSSAGCNYPEGGCLGLCMHRVHPSQVEQVNALPINFAGPEPVEDSFTAEERAFFAKEHKPEPGLIAGFIKLIGGNWKCE